MAKDKGKKKGGGFSDEFGKPSEAKGGGDGWRLEHEDNIGDLFLISPLREDDFTSEEYGTSKIIVCDVVAINEKKPEKSQEHTDVYLFGGWTKGAVRGYIGERRVLARLDQDASKSRSKKNPAWVLIDADEKDAKIARAYIESIDPFKQKGAKSKDDDDDKPAKKGKKSAEEAPAKKGKKSADADEAPAKKKKAKK